jgi:hypothetical protein
MPSMRLPVLAAALVLGALAAGCTEMDEAALVDPGEQRVAADAGDLRVLRHHDDPPAGDEWLDVLEPDPAVVTRTGAFREDDSRHAEADEAADLRLLYEGAGEGRTILVRMNCRGCRDGVPALPPEDVELLVWEFVIGDPGDREPTLGSAAIAPGRAHQVGVGDHVVVVRAARGGSVEGLDDEVLRLVASHEPGGAGDLAVDVFAAVGSGETSFRYGPGPLDGYAVRVT